MGLFSLRVFVRISLGDVWVTSRTRVGRIAGNEGVLAGLMGLDAAV